MTDLALLRARLARLVEPPGLASGTTRILTGQGLPSPMNALVREIEETQLPRALTFLNDHNDSLTLRVKAGRIAAILDLPTSTSSAAPIVGVPLSNEDAGQKAKLFGIIADFVQDTINVSVIVDPVTTIINPAFRGICPTAYFSKLERSDPPPESIDSPHPLSESLARYADVATAWALIEGQKTRECHGDPLAVSKLAALAQSEFTKRTLSIPGVASVAEDTRCVIFRGAGIDDDAILYGKLGASTVLMSFPSSKFFDVMAKWGRTTTRSVP